MPMQLLEAYDTPENDTRPSQRRLVVGFLAGPVVYSVYFFAVYLLVEAACREALLRVTLWGLDGLALAVLGLTGATVVLTLGLALFAFRGRQAELSAEAQGNRHFITRIGLWLSGFFVVVTLVTGGPIIFLERCRWV